MRKRGPDRNLVGMTFERWTVVGDRVGRKWLCRCSCGTQKLVESSNLTAGKSRSCGCLIGETASKNNRRHGMSLHPVYLLWKNMRRRCDDPTSVSYARYGARGIKVCERWGRFENFYSDMGDRPEGKSLDRIDNDGDYSPDNCRWSTPAEQGQNTRRNRWIEHDGVRKTATQWADELGMCTTVLNYRLNNWSVADALNVPLGTDYRHRRRTKLNPKPRAKAKETP